jgi:hypothetical protein
LVLVQVFLEDGFCAFNCRQPVGSGEFGPDIFQGSCDGFVFTGELDFPPVPAVAGIDGSGQTVFVVDSFGVAMRFFHCISFAIRVKKSFLVTKQVTMAVLACKN